MEVRPAVTFRQFADTVTAFFGVHYGTRVGYVNDQSPHVIHGLERERPDGFLWYPIVMGDDERMTARQLEAACRRLEIGVEDFFLRFG